MSEQHARERALFAQCFAGLLHDQPAPLQDELSRIDWNYVLDRAEEHLLQTIVKRYVEQTGANELLSIEAKAKLSAAYVDSVANSLAVSSWLADFVDRAGQRGIPVILLKGILLATELYDVSTLRPFTDVDILVPPNDVCGCAEILGSMGLALEEGNDLSELLRIYNHAAFCPTGEARVAFGLPVELHWGFHQVDNSASFSQAAIWDSARQVSIGGVKTHALSLEDEIIFGAHHLCNHVFFNSTPALRWFLDLALRLRVSKTEIDWDVLLDRSRLHNAWPSCAAAFAVLTGVFDADVPEDVRCLSLETFGGAFRRLLERISFADLLEERLSASGCQRLVAQLGLNPGLRAKSAFVALRLRSWLTRAFRSMGTRVLAEV